MRARIEGEDWVMDPRRARTRVRMGQIPRMDAAGVAPRTRHTLDREERGPQASTRIINRELDSGPNIEDTEETQRISS